MSRREPFGTLDNGKQVDLFTLTNKNGVVVELLNYGATIRSVKLPGKDGQLVDIVLGYDEIDGYRSSGNNGKNPYFGAICGRVANRIANGAFTLDGKKYSLAKNNGPNSLHGGVTGYDKVMWDAFINLDGSVTFTYLSKDGEEGYPGDVTLNVTYTLTEENGLELSILGVTTKATPINIANHAYFNLAGHDTGSQGLGQHWMAMNADHYLPVSEVQIPTGPIADVGGTVFDLRIPSQLVDRLPNCPGGPDFNGYDHNFCIIGSGMKFVCRVEHKETERALEVRTNQPGVQFYTGNFIPNDDSLRGRNGCSYRKHGGFCLETQAFPDAINQSKFHRYDSVLRPGQVYDHKVEYRFFFAK